MGGGDSHFIDAVLAKGYRNVWLLDISENAIERAKKRLGDKDALVHFVVSEVVDFKPEVKFDFWHDRAAFHFITRKLKLCVVMLSSILKIIQMKLAYDSEEEGQNIKEVFTEPE